MIRGFADKKTEIFWNTGKNPKIPPTIRKRAYRKLQLMHAATTLEFLRVPPSNHLEKLSGDREGAYSIRINQQFRLVFTWKDGHADDVEIVDYH
jgi:proteic killer suppression protein